MSLGLVLYVTHYRVCPEQPITRHMAEAILSNLVSLIGMNTAGLPCHIHEFPLNGNGGVGLTAFQPFTESHAEIILPGLATIDTWPEHGHIYVTICSCKNYSPTVVADYLHHWIGPVRYIEGFVDSGGMPKNQVAIRLQALEEQYARAAKQ